jgi:hypothetical protein
MTRLAVTGFDGALVGGDGGGGVVVFHGCDLGRRSDP